MKRMLLTFVALAGLAGQAAAEWSFGGVAMCKEIKSYCVKSCEGAKFVIRPRDSSGISCNCWCWVDVGNERKRTEAGPEGPQLSLDWNVDLSGQFQAQLGAQGLGVAAVAGKAVAQDQDQDKKEQLKKDVARITALLERIKQGEAVEKAEIEFAKDFINKNLLSEEALNAMRAQYRAYIKEKGMKHDKWDIPAGASDEEMAPLVEHLIEAHYKPQMGSVLKFLDSAKTKE